MSANSCPCLFDLPGVVPVDASGHRLPSRRAFTCCARGDRRGGGCVLLDPSRDQHGVIDEDVVGACERAEHDGQAAVSRVDRKAHHTGGPVAATRTVRLARHRWSRNRRATHGHATVRARMYRCACVGCDMRGVEDSPHPELLSPLTLWLALLRLLLNRSSDWGGRCAFAQS
jgi:hypothetical protein